MVDKVKSQDLTPNYVLGLLLVINLVNYLDRQMLYSLLPLIQNDLKITDAQAGRLASAFMVVYMFAAIPIGYWADKYGRKLFIWTGVVFWSLATAASGLAMGYLPLFYARSAVGIGESSFVTISPSFVAEHFPYEKRSSALAWFSMAIPVGSALGYLVGGSLGEFWGWRKSLLLVSVPGLILAVMASRLKDPSRNHHRGNPLQAEEGTANVSLHSREGGVKGFSAYLDLFRTPSFSCATLASAAMTFALGGFAVWMPSFLHRQWGLGVGKAGTIFGAITVLSGVFGSLTGGWLSDWTLKWTKNAHFLISGLGLLLGTPLALMSLQVPTLRLACLFLFGAEFLFFLNMGPLNAIVVAVTDLRSRSMAFAANLFVIHALGDAVSPAIIGSISDRVGLKPALMETCASLVIASLFCFLGMRYYTRDADTVGAN